MFENGFKFVANTSGWIIAPDSWSFSPPPTQNGTGRYLWSGNGNGGTGGGRVEMSDQTSALFSLESFDAAVMFNDNRTNTVKVLGNINGGGTISATFKPLAALAKSAKVSITTSASSTPLSVSLSGTGT